MDEQLRKRECFARWLLAMYRRGNKTKEQVEAWLVKQPDEQRMREVMRSTQRQNGVNRLRG
jgi:hypothetical protein